MTPSTTPKPTGPAVAVGAALGPVATRQPIGYTAAMSQLVDAIRGAIEASDQTPAAIARGAGVAKSQLSRLLSGERGLSVDTLEQLADYLELRITIEPKAPTKGKTTKGK